MIDLTVIQTGITFAPIISLFESNINVDHFLKAFVSDLNGFDGRDEIQGFPHEIRSDTLDIVYPFRVLDACASQIHSIRNEVNPNVEQ
jgi:hypothetical protein